MTPDATTLIQDPALRLTDGQGHPRVLGPLLGQGGEGAVYRSDRAGEVVKLYLTPPDAEQVLKLKAMSRLGTPDLLAHSSWPTHLIYGAHPQSGEQAVLGLTMPLLPPGSRPLHDLLGVGSRQEHFPSADLHLLLQVAVNLSESVAGIHLAGHRIGDFNSNNVQVAPSGEVTLIDVDSFDVRDGAVRYACQVGVPEYTAPELQGRPFEGQDRTPEADVFALAVFVFQLLYRGRHPFAGVWDPGWQDASGSDGPPSLGEAVAKSAFVYSRRHDAGARPPPGVPGLDLLPDTLTDLFEDSFSPEAASGRGGAARPSALRWAEALSEAATRVTTCRSGHQHFQDRPCAGCQQERSRVRAQGSWSRELAQRAQVEEANAAFARLELNWPVVDPALLRPAPTLSPVMATAWGVAGSVVLPLLVYLPLQIPGLGLWSEAFVVTVPTLLGLYGWQYVQTGRRPAVTARAGRYMLARQLAEQWTHRQERLLAEGRRLAQELDAWIPADPADRQHSPTLQARAGVRVSFARHAAWTRLAQQHAGLLDTVQDQLNRAAAPV